MRKDRIPVISGDEHDWTTKWRRWLCVFKNNTGLGKKVKHAINKRTRRRIRQELLNPEDDE